MYFLKIVVNLMVALLVTKVIIENYPLVNVYVNQDSLKMVLSQLHVVNVTITVFIVLIKKIHVLNVIRQKE